MRGALAVLAIVLASLPAPPAATAQPGTPVVFDGMHVSALGAATVEVVTDPATGERRLPVNNLGSSGQDGVEISLGQAARGHVIFVDLAADVTDDPSASWNVSLHGESAAGLPDQMGLSAVRNSNGSLTLTPNFGASTRVVLLDANRVIRKRCHAPVVIVKEWNASTPKLAGYILMGKGDGPHHRWIEVELRSPASVDDGNGGPETVCRSIIFECETCDPLASLTSTRMTYTAPSTPGSVTCTALEIEPPCAGCPNGPEELGDAGALRGQGDGRFAFVGGAITLDNLGSSGQGGVRVMGGEGVTHLGLGISGITPTDPATPCQMTFHATATTVGSSTVDAGQLACTTDGTDWDFTPDFSSTGADGYRALLYMNGTQVADVTNPTDGVRKWGDGHVTLMKIDDDGSEEMRIICITSPCPNSPITMNGVQYTANEIRLRPTYPVGVAPPVFRNLEQVAMGNIFGTQVITISGSHVVTLPPGDVIFDGVHVQALGGATIGVETDPVTGERRLPVNNLGSSGQDGVDIQLGSVVKGCWIGLDASGQTNAGTLTRITMTGQSGGMLATSDLSTLRNSDGSLTVTPGPGNIDVVYDLLDAEGHRAKRMHAPFMVVKEWGGSTPLLAKVLCKAVINNLRQRLLELEFTAPVSVDDGSGEPEVACKKVRITVTAQDAMGNVTSVKVKWSRTNGVDLYRLNRIGIVPPCAGCPNGPDDGEAGSLVSEGNADYGLSGSAIMLDNLGSSGQDGVSVIGGPHVNELGLAVPNIGCCRGPVGSPGHTTLLLRGKANGVDQPVGQLECTTDGTEWSFTPDFSSIGASGYRALLYLDGTQVADVSNPSAGVRRWGDGHVTLMKAYDDGSVEMRIVCITSPCPTSPITMNGVQYAANEIRLQPLGPALPAISDLEKLTATNTNVQVLTISGTSFKSGRLPAQVSFGGLTHSALGSATVEVETNPATGERRLPVSNLGSSGEDGVAVDLGPAAKGHGFVWDSATDLPSAGSTSTVSLRGGITSSGPDVGVAEVQCVRNSDGSETLSSHFAGVNPAGIWAVLVDASGATLRRQHGAVVTCREWTSTPVGRRSCVCSIAQPMSRVIKTTFDHDVAVDDGSGGNIICRKVVFIAYNAPPATLHSITLHEGYNDLGTTTLDLLEEHIVPPCAGCPNGPDDTGDLVANGDAMFGLLGSAMTLDNLGSPGQDGVSVIGGEGCCAVTELGLSITDSQQATPAVPGVLNFDWFGTMAGTGGRRLGGLHTNQDGPEWSFVPDFSPLGATGYHVVLYRNGTVVGDVPNPPDGVRKWGDGHVTLMKAYDDGEVECRIICITNPCPGSNVTLGGAQYLVDEVAFKPLGSSLPAVSNIQRMTALESGLITLTIKGTNFKSTAPTIGVGESGGVVDFNAPRLLPNPASGPVSVMFALPVAGRVKVTVVDVTGRRVRGLASGAFTAGAHRLSWDGRDEAGNAAAAGLYFLRVESGAASRVARLTLLR